jgi:PEGA domain
MTHRTVRLVCAVAASGLAAAAGAADSLGVLAVADPPGPPAELAELNSQFRAVLAERTGGVLEPSELRNRMMGQTSSASLSELDRAFAGALATYQAGDFEGSIRTLRAVIEDLERLPEGPATFSQWTRAMLRLARAEQTVGRRPEANALLERLVRAAPDVKVDTNQYPPSYAKQVEALQAQVKSHATRKLTVNAAQKGVKVYVEGREVGTAPVTVSLPPARYRVSGRSGDLRAPAVTADLSEADQTVGLDFGLAEALRPGAGPGLVLSPADRARKIVAAAAWLGLDRAVITSMPQDADITYLQATLYDVRKGQMQREGRLRLSGKAPPPGGLIALATFLMTGQPSSLVAPAPSPQVVGAEPPAVPRPAVAAARPAPVQVAAPAPGPSPVLRWSPVVAGVLTVGLGAFALYEGSKSGSEYSKAKDMLSNGWLNAGASPADYNKHISDGNSAKSLAVATGVGAGVCLAGTAVLGYLSYKRTGEIGPWRF